MEPIDLMNVKTTWNSQKTNSYCDDVNYQDANSVYADNDDEEFIVILTNFLTNQLENDDIEILLDSFITDSQVQKEVTYEFDSIQVFKDCIYLIFLSKCAALDAIAFFNDYQYKSHWIQAHAIKNEELCLKTNGVFGQKELAKFSEIDCEILVATRQSKKYADSLNEKLSKELLGINTLVRYICDEPDDKNPVELENLLENAIKKNILYVIHIDQTCEQFNSINLYMLNQWKNECEKTLKKYNFSNKITKIVSKKKSLIKENKNMPLNKALEQLKDDYCDYIMFIKAKESALAQSKLADALGSNKCDLEEEENEKLTDIDKKYSRLMSILQRLLVDENEVDKSLSGYRIKDLEFLIIYLNRLKCSALKIPENLGNPLKNEGQTEKANSETTNGNSKNTNIKSLLDTDLTKNPSPQPLMPPKPLLNQQTILPPQPLLPSIMQHQPLMQQHFPPQRFNIGPLMSSMPQNMPNFSHMSQMSLMNQMPQMMPQMMDLMQSQNFSHNGQPRPLLSNFSNHSDVFSQRPQSLNDLMGQYQSPRPLMPDQSLRAPLMNIHTTNKKKNNLNYKNSHNND